MRMKYIEKFDIFLYGSKMELDKLISKYPHKEIKCAVLGTLLVELVIHGPMCELLMMDTMREKFPLLSPVHYHAQTSSDSRELSFPFKEELASEGLIEVFAAGGSSAYSISLTQAGKAFLDANRK